MSLFVARPATAATVWVVVIVIVIIVVMTTTVVSSFPMSVVQRLPIQRRASSTGTGTGTNPKREGETTTFRTLSSSLSSSSLSLKRRRQLSSNIVNHVHLIVLVHGWLGSPNELDYLSETLQRRQQEEEEEDQQQQQQQHETKTTIVHSATCNDGRTSDGIAPGGTRLANEINIVLGRLQGKDKDKKDKEDGEWRRNSISSLDSNSSNNNNNDHGDDGDDDRYDAVVANSSITVSLVGNSLGGLYARYAVKDIHWNWNVEGDGVVTVRPGQFITTCTPHLGVSKHTYVRIPRLLEHIIGSAMGQTGKDLFQIPSLSSTTTTSTSASTSASTSSSIVQQLATNQEFLRPLSQFQRRVAYANVYGTDFQVPTSTAAFWELDDSDGNEDERESDCYSSPSASLSWSPSSSLHYQVLPSSKTTGIGKVIPPSEVVMTLKTLRKRQRPHNDGGELPNATIAMPRSVKGSTADILDKIPLSVSQTTTTTSPTRTALFMMKKETLAPSSSSSSAPTTDDREVYTHNGYAGYADDDKDDIDPGHRLDDDDDDDYEGHQVSNNARLSKQLDELGWTKVLCDVRRHLFPTFPFSKLPSSSSSTFFTPKDLLRLFDVGYFRHFPLGHTISVANSKDSMNRWITKGGRPIMDYLASDVHQFFDERMAPSFNRQEEEEELQLAYAMVNNNNNVNRNNNGRSTVFNRRTKIDKNNRSSSSRGTLKNNRGQGLGDNDGVGKNQQTEKESTNMLSRIMSPFTKSAGGMILFPFVLIFGIDLILNILVITKRTFEYFVLGQAPSSEPWF